MPREENQQDMTRVKLRPIRVADAEVCFSWVTDPDVARYLGLLQAPITVEAERAWIARAISDKANQRVFVIEDENGRAIGTCGLRGIDREAGHAFLGIMVGAKRVWDQGYGTAATMALVDFAFRSLGLREVRLGCHVDNRRGLRCYQKAGFGITQDKGEDRIYGRAEVRMVIGRAKWEALRREGRGEAGQALAACPPSEEDTDGDYGLPL